MSEVSLNIREDEQLTQSPALPVAPPAGECVRLPVGRRSFLRRGMAAVGAAAEHGLELPLTALALERYEAAREAGFGQLDYSAVARLFGDPDE